MDFATIKAKVDSAAYKSPQDFFNDMKLVFTNARRYNPPGSDVNLMANGVEVTIHLLRMYWVLLSLAEHPMRRHTSHKLQLAL